MFKRGKTLSIHSTPTWCIIEYLGTNKAYWAIKGYKMFTYTQAKAIIKTLGRFTIESYEHYGLSVIDTENGEYAIGTEEEADYAWDESLDSYLEECVYPEIPDNMVNYFNDEAWKRDARHDGRGHSLSSYDGNELDILDLVAFRIN